MSGLVKADDDDPSGEFPLNPKLAALTSEITRKIEAGEHVEADDYIRRYPAWAGPISLILPVIRDLVRLGRR